MCKQQLGWCPPRRAAVVPLIVLCAVMVGLGFPSPRHVDAAGPAPAVDVSSGRSLYLTVRDDDDLVADLSAEHFEVLVAGEPREFVLREPEPAQITILVEYSAFSLGYLNDIFGAMRGVVGSASAGHWYALATYGDEVTIAQDFNKRRGLIAQTFVGLPPLRQDGFAEGLRTYDAVYEMVETLTWMSGRRVLIVIGSGLDRFSRRNQKDILEELEPSGVTVFGLGALSGARRGWTNNTDLQFTAARAQTFLTRLADQSGGFARFPPSPDQFLGEARNIFAALDAQYELVYMPRSASDPESDDIEVRAFRQIDGQMQQFTVVTRAVRASGRGQ